MCRFTVVVTDRPGGMAEMLAIIAENGGSIKEVFFRLKNSFRTFRFNMIEFCWLHSFTKSPWSAQSKVDPIIMRLWFMKNSKKDSRKIWLGIQSRQSTMVTKIELLLKRVCHFYRENLKTASILFIYRVLTFCLKIYKTSYLYPVMPFYLFIELFCKNWLRLLSKSNYDRNFFHNFS